MRGCRLSRGIPCVELLGMEFRTKLKVAVGYVFCCELL